MHLNYCSLLKLKKNEGLIYNDEHEVVEMNQTMDALKDMDGRNNFKQPGKCVLNKTHKIIIIGELAGSAVYLAT